MAHIPLRHRLATQGTIDHLTTLIKEETSPSWVEFYTVLRTLVEREMGRPLNRRIKVRHLMVDAHWKSFGKETYNHIRAAAHKN